MTDDRPRFTLGTAWPAGYQAMSSFTHAVNTSGLEENLIQLVYMRASQINGCAYCLDMHSKDARAAGETEQRLYALAAWRETPFFSVRERAALAFTEALTLVARTRLSEDVVDQATDCFSEDELAKLAFAIAEINAWNRLAIAARLEVGGYQPRAGARA